jgi:hypothetical protein
MWVPAVKKTAPAALMAKITEGGKNFLPMCRAGGAARTTPQRVAGQGLSDGSSTGQ